MSGEMQSPERHDLCLIWGNMSMHEFLEFLVEGTVAPLRGSFLFCSYCALYAYCCLLRLVITFHVLVAFLGPYRASVVCVHDAIKAFAPRCGFEDLSGPLPALCTQMDIRLIWFLLNFQICFQCQCLGWPVICWSPVFHGTLLVLLYSWLLVR